MAFGEFLASFAGAFQATNQQRFQNELLERQQQQQEKEFERNTQLAGMRMEFEKQRVEQDAQQFELDQKRRKIEIDALSRATGNANIEQIQDMVNGLSIATQKQKYFESQGNTEQANYQKFLKNQITARARQLGPSLFGGAPAAAPPGGGLAAAEPGTAPQATQPIPGGGEAPAGAPTTPTTKLPPDKEKTFQTWYAERAQKLGLDTNPDAPEHQYDYRAAFQAGAEPNAEGHWPSQFKMAGHPNRFVGGMDTITGQPAPAPPGQPEAPAQFGTPAFYKRVQGIKPGTPEAHFTTPEGTAVQVLETPEEVKAFNDKQKAARSLFKEDEAAMFVPPVMAISRVEAKAKEVELNRMMREARMEEVQGKHQEEVMQTAEQQNAINDTIKQAKGTSRVQASEQGVIVTGFNVDNMTRERVAIDQLAEKGQLNRTTLEAYNNAYGSAITEALQKRPELNDVLTSVSPGEYRIKTLFRPKTDLQARAVTTAQDLMQMSNTFEEQGLPPSVVVRSSRPEEVVGDFASQLPDGAQFIETPIPGVLGGRKNVKSPRDRSSVNKVNEMVAQLSSGLARSLYDLPADQREAALAQARGTLAAVGQNYWIGQGPITGFAPKTQELGFQALSELGLGIGRTGEITKSTRAFEESTTAGFKALQSILGKPKAEPTPVTPTSGAPAGKPTSQAEEPQGGAGAIGGMRGALTMAAMGGVPGGKTPPKTPPKAPPKTPPKVEASEGAKTFNASFQTMANAKNRNEVAKATVSDIRTGWGGMTEAEKKTARATWVTQKNKWKQWKVDDNYINEVESFINPKAK